MRRAERINDPMIIFLMRDQRADADNRVVDVLWKFVARVRREFRHRSCRRDHSPQRSLRGQAPFQCPIRARVACQALGVYRSI